MKSNNLNNNKKITLYADLASSHKSNFSILYATKNAKIDILYAAPKDCESLAPENVFAGTRYNFRKLNNGKKEDIGKNLVCSW